MKRTAPSRRAQALRTAAESLKLEKLRLRVAEAEQRLRRQAAASAEFGGEDEEEAEEEAEEEEDLEDLEFGGRAEDEDLMEAHQRLRRGAGAPGVAGAAPSSRRGGNVGGVASAARVGGVAPPAGLPIGAGHPRRLGAVSMTSAGAQDDRAARARSEYYDPVRQQNSHNTCHSMLPL